jgi:hypothetical protein
MPKGYSKAGEAKRTELLALRISPEMRDWLETASRQRGQSMTTTVIMALRAIRRQWDIEDAAYSRQVRGAVAETVAD